jgi:hypothetical protein
MGRSERVEEHNQISRPNVEHAIELRPVVTTKLTKLSFHLRAVGKREMRIRSGEQIQAINLVVQRHLGLRVPR